MERMDSARWSVTLGRKMWGERRWGIIWDWIHLKKWWHHIFTKWRILKKTK
jgi:hypothetical protein